MAIAGSVEELEQLDGEEWNEQTAAYDIEAAIKHLRRAALIARDKSIGVTVEDVIEDVQPRLEYLRHTFFLLAGLGFDGGD